MTLDELRTRISEAGIPLATNGLHLVDNTYTVYVLLTPDRGPHAIRLALGKVFAKLKRETGITVSWRSRGVTHNECHYSFKLEEV